MKPTYGNNTPDEVIEYIDARKNDRIPSYCEGDFEKFRDSKTSCCWGNRDGMGSENYEIYFCAPSIRSKGQIPVLFFDYRKR